MTTHPFERRALRPSVLRPVESPKAWGWELWLTSTRPEAPATFADGEDTLAHAVDARPDMIGAGCRQLFGDGMPIFTKLIHTNFPRRVHLGFRRRVERAAVLARLECDRDLVRELLSALRTPDETAFGAFQERHGAWASAQALAGWRRDDDVAAAATLAPHLDHRLDLAGWLRRARDNRAAFVDDLHEIDLAREEGTMFLSSAGLLHAIFGLSHQTHPRDRARAALESLHARLAERAAAGASDAELEALAAAARLDALRSGAAAPPKNEAWLPVTLDGEGVLVEPQQTSDTTYSVADFYTPLVWGEGRPRFRKGSPDGGVPTEQLEAWLADVDVEATSLDAIRRRPRPMPGARRDRAGALQVIVDEPAAWPFFSAYQLDLDRGRIEASPPPGSSTQIVVTRGRLELGDAHGAVGWLSSRAAGLVPAGTAGSYFLRADEPATALLLSVPGLRGGAPRVVPAR